MKTLVRIFVVALLLVSATAEFVFGQGMVYQTHQEMTLAAADGLTESWVQLPNSDKVRVTTDGSSVTIESTAGWSQTIPHTYSPCVAEYNGTLWCAMSQSGGVVTINGTTHPTPPSGESYTLLVKLNSTGSILDSWQAIGSMGLWNIAVKDNGEIAVVGSAGSTLEHLTSGSGGVVLIHDGTDWDTSKGFFIETPMGGGNPIVYSAQYLPSGNLVLSGRTNGGNVSFGGIILPPHGNTDGFRGEITSSGVGITAVQMGGNGVEMDVLQSTKADGSFMVTGTYTQLINFYNADGSVGGSLGQFPSGASHDHIYFAYYSSAGVFQNAEVAYNTVATTDLRNIDLTFGNDAFYAMIDCQDGGTSVMPTGEEYTYPSPIVLKFDASGNASWAKQIQATVNTGGYGEEILVSVDVVTLTGTEYGTCDLDFNSGVVSISNTSYWAEYFDGTIVGPTADFSGTPLNGECPLNVSFTDLSVAGTNGITSWTWTFQGGTPGTYSGQNPPAIVYATAGTYDVTLVVSDGSLSDIELKADYVMVSAPAPYMTINPSTVTVSAAAGNVTSMFTITSNESWSIETSDQYVTASPSSGSGNQSIDVTYPAINTMAGEIYTVTVTSNSNIVEVFTINQDGVPASITLSDYSQTVGSEAGSYPIVVTCPNDMTGSVSAGIFSSASPDTFTGSTTVTINYDENTSPDSRVDILTFSGSGVSADFTLTQLGVGAPLQVTTSALASVVTLGASTQLFANPSGGTGNYTFLWTGPGDFNSTEQNPMVTPPMEGENLYHVAVNDEDTSVGADEIIQAYEVSFYLEATPMNGTTDDEYFFHSEVIQNPNDPRTVDYHSIEFGDGDMFEGEGNIVETSHMYQEAGSYDIEQAYVLSDGSSDSKTSLSFVGVITDVCKNIKDETQIYPNPTTGLVFINAGKSVERLSIVNMTGSEVIHLENLGENARIDLAKFPNGLYFFILEIDGQRLTYKEIKQ